MTRRLRARAAAIFKEPRCPSQVVSPVVLQAVSSAYGHRESLQIAYTFLDPRASSVPPARLRLRSPLCPASMRDDETDVGSALGFVAFALLWYSTSLL